MLEKPVIKEEPKGETVSKNPKTSDASTIYIYLAILSFATFVILKKNYSSALIQTPK